MGSTEAITVEDRAQPSGAPDSASTSEGVRAHAANASAAGTVPGGRGGAGFVVPKRGAGAGWRWPPTSMKAPRAWLCGWACASVMDRTGAKQASEPSRMRHQSSRVRVRKRSVSSLAKATRCHAELLLRARSNRPQAMAVFSCSCWRDTSGTGSADSTLPPVYASFSSVAPRTPIVTSAGTSSFASASSGMRNFWR